MKKRGKYCVMFMFYAGFTFCAAAFADGNAGESGWLMK
jgi:hypothetical protein